MDDACPNVAAGELVVTEFRGSQDGADTYGEWLEVFNAGDSAIDLGGLRVRALDLDGGSQSLFMVRDGQLRLEPGDYAVFGGLDREPLPAHLDYSFAVDGVTGLRAGAIVTLESCGEVIDETLYRSLPSVGTWSLDGTLVPDAEVNDLEEAWCTDDLPDEAGGPVTELGVPGTPGQPNRECGT